jgi:hypothetical protein
VLGENGANGRKAGAALRPAAKAALNLTWRPGTFRFVIKTRPDRVLREDIAGADNHAETASLTDTFY